MKHVFLAILALGFGVSAFADGHGNMPSFDQHLNHELNLLQVEFYILQNYFLKPGHLYWLQKILHPQFEHQAYC